MIRPWLLTLGLTARLLGWLVLAFPAAHTQADEQETQVVWLHHAAFWQHAIALIERDRVAGILSTDEAALLRFTALTAWQHLHLTPPHYPA